MWPGWPVDDEEDDENIRIIDLGEVFNNNAVPKTLAQPGGLQTPNRFFPNYYLVFGALPYSWWRINPLVEAMIDAVRELPPEWESKWEQMKSDAAARGKSGAGKWKQSSDWRLERQFDKHVQEPELNALLPVIQGLTNLLPSDRVSASQALQLIRKNSGNIEHSAVSNAVGRLLRDLV
ncbi:hypothetical protein LTR72_012222 [Exophiala xenobiotica]|nr:hypothetical protein LTR72_012222 [Exophiala xenobiotica]